MTTGAAKAGRDRSVVHPAVSDTACPGTASRLPQPVGRTRA
ncbi:MAG: hypothetical protein AVDCRST_MAG06-2097 [uncultured Nocardioides sp.]|uniref:Uncharacterized protein n=1 Tax=uncultured Nocardioides sp. TaxID=198441 RepID=A0A6J4P482_9ACTN|nr:MAG: hypothetical protein AVDCRST_MAG06-2097 [uncultured Nocardioides sp.]